MADIEQAKIPPDLKNWSSKIEEVSAGVYTVRGTDKGGRRVEMTGTDPDLLLSNVKMMFLSWREKKPERIDERFSFFSIL